MHIYSQLIKAQLEHVASNPASIGKAFIYFNTTTNEAVLDNGTEVKPFLTESNLNAVMQDLGITAKSDTRANLEALATELGALYVITDEDNTLVYDNGTELLNAGGFDKKLTMAVLEALPRKAGKIYYATDDAIAVLDNGVELVPVGAIQFLEQRKLSSTLTTNGVVAELGVTGMELGKQHRLTLTMSCSRIGVAQNEIQDLTFSAVPNEGYFKLTLDAETTAKLWYDTTALELENMLIALPSVDASGISVVGDFASGFTIEFIGTEGSVNQSQISVAESTLKSGGTGGVNEVQRVTFSETPTGGTFTITYDGQTTGAIAYNASITTVKNALEALPNIDGVTVTAV